MDTTPPHNPDREAWLIGACFVDSQSADNIFELAAPNDFYVEKHRAIMEGIFQLYQKNRNINPSMLELELTKIGKLDKAGGKEYIEAVRDGYPTAANDKVYAKEIRDLAIRREIIRACQQGQSDGYRDDLDTKTYASNILAGIEDAIKERMKNPIRSVGETIRETMNAIDKQFRDGKKITGLRTGYPDLDVLTGGFAKGDLIIIAGRPGAGKSGLVLNILENAAAYGKTGLLFSLEMSVDKLNRRLLSSASRVFNHRLQFPGMLRGEDIGRLVDASNELTNYPIYMDDSADVSLLDIRARARRFKSKHDLDVLVIDYLQNMMTSSRKETTREREIAEITRGAKALSKELDIPVVLLSSLNRDCERRDNKRPRKSDLRDSGSIEHDADIVMFVYREAMYKADAGDEAEIIIDKNRNGPCGMVRLKFVDTLVRFESLASAEVEAQMQDQQETEGDWHD
jgi:replicative DNA helicase